MKISFTFPDTGVGLGKSHGDNVASSLYPNRRGWNASHTTRDGSTTSNSLCGLYVGPSIGALGVLRPIYRRKIKYIHMYKSLHNEI